MLSKKNATKVLILILTLGFVVRLHGFTNPIADWHSWRQADTSAVSRNFVNDGFDLLHPTFDDLSNVASGIDNPKGYRFVEFPIYNVFQAGLTKYIGILSLEEWGRVVTIIASLFGSFFLYKIVSKYSGSVAGLATAFFYTFLPYNIYYGRTILPDPSMVAAILGGLYFFDLWLSDKKQRLLPFIAAILLTAAAALLKPYALFYGLPFIVLAYNEFGFKLLLKIKLWIFAILIICPLVMWRLWIAQYPEGIPVNAWLLNGNGIRFRPSFFRWIGYERLIKLISGYAGAVLLLVGAYQLRFEKQKLLYGSFIVSAVVYVCVFATGNVQHDYYQIVIMPVVAIMYGLSAKYLLEDKHILPLPLQRILFCGITILALTLSWMQVKDYFNINNHAIIIAGQDVDRLIPKDAKIIANYTGDTSFLYQTKRKGWASFESSIPEMVRMGASYLVLANPTPADELLKGEFKLVKETPDYLLFDITKKP